MFAGGASEGACVRLSECPREYRTEKTIVGVEMSPVQLCCISFSWTYQRIRDVPALPALSARRHPSAVGVQEDADIPALQFLKYDNRDVCCACHLLQMFKRFPL